VSRPAANEKALHDLINSSGLKPRENSRSWIFDCPKCGKEKKLFLLKTNGNFACWVCKDTIGYKGAPEYALTDLLNRSVTDLKRILYGESAIRSTQYLVTNLRDFFAEDDEMDEDAGELQEVLWPIDYYPIDHKFSGRGLAYLQGRGVSLELAQKYGVRYCPPSRRVIFPIQYQGKLYGWQGRAVFDTETYDPETGKTDSVPKVLTTKGLQKESLFMYMDNLGGEHAVLTEGPMDGIKADLCGGNVVSMGKAVSAQQVGLLRNSGVKRIYLALDRDAATEIYRVAREFYDVETYLMLAPRPWHDHGEMEPEGVLETFRQAQLFNNAVLIDGIDTDFEAVQARALRWQKRGDRGRRTR
jgi:hypothetical protein